MESTPLGAFDTWRPELIAVVNQMLYTSQPGFLYWGPHFITLYNDAGIPVLSNKHPQSLGQPAAAVWKELWHILGPQIEKVYSEGEVGDMRRVPLPILQSDTMVTMYWDYALIPIRDAKRQILGVSSVGRNMTDTVAGKRS